MAEERTVSRFTKLNAPDRASQKPPIIISMTQIQQHLRRELAGEMEGLVRGSVELELHPNANYPARLRSSKDQFSNSINYQNTSVSWSFGLAFWFS